MIVAQLSAVSCQLSCQLSAVNCQLSPVTCHLLPFTCHLSPVTCHLSPVTCHLSSAMFSPKVLKHRYVALYHVKQILIQTYSNIVLQNQIKLPMFDMSCVHMSIVMLILPPPTLDSETGWTGDFWLNCFSKCWKKKGGKYFFCEFINMKAIWFFCDCTVYFLLFNNIKYNFFLSSSFPYKSF